MTNDSDAPTPDDDVLAMRALLRDRPAAQGDASIGPETLQAFFDGELSADEAQAVALSLAADPSLGEDMRVTASLGRARAEASRVETPARPSRSRFVWTAVAAVAAAVLAFWVLRAPSPSSGPNSGGSDEIRAGSETRPIVSTVSGESLPRDAFDLAWSGGPKDATWDVQVTTEGLAVVFQAFDRTESKVRVPATALRGLDSGTALLWRVTATDTQGRPSRSAAFTVRVQ